MPVQLVFVPRCSWKLVKANSRRRHVVDACRVRSVVVGCCGCCWGGACRVVHYVWVQEYNLCRTVCVCRCMCRCMCAVSVGRECVRRDMCVACYVCGDGSRDTRRHERVWCPRRACARTADRQCGATAAVCTLVANRTCMQQCSRMMRCVMCAPSSAATVVLQRCSTSSSVCVYVCVHTAVVVRDETRSVGCG